MSQYRAYGILSLLALLATLLAALRPGAPFRPYFGRIPPLLGVVACLALGLGCLAYLTRVTPLRVSASLWRSPAALRFLLLALVLPLPAILLDLYFRFPKDLNVPVPLALGFYPAIAMVAEVVFHLVPLAILAAAVQWASGQPLSGTGLPICLIIVACVEPTFQVLATPVGGSAPLLSGLVGLQVLVVNLVALWAFSRLDFVSLYTFRLVYYLIWHIAWGTWRLQLFA